MASEIIKKNIMLLGDGAVGKTSLIRRFVIDRFDDKYITTIGTKVTKKEIYFKYGADDVRMVMLVWDILGQRGYKYTQALSFGGIEGAVLVSDITRKDTLTGLVEYWAPSLLSVTGPVPMVFIGNKGDLVSDAEFGEGELRDAASSIAGGGPEPQCFITSAKTGEHVDEAFHKLASAVKDITAQAREDVTKVILDKEGLTSLVSVADHIIADFSNQFGGVDNATPILKHQITRIGMNITNPKKKELIELVNALAEVEKSFKPPEVVNLNRTKRLYLVNNF